MIDLPPKMATLFGMLPKDQDVDIVKLHFGYFGDVDADPRRCMQRLGPQVTKLNRRLARHRLKVQPGRLKRTYRLVSL